MLRPVARAPFAGSRRVAELWPFALAAALAALWPLSAYALDPALLPGTLALAVAGALVVWRPEHGVGLVLALAPLTNAAVGGGGVVPLPDKPLHFAVPALALAVLAYATLVSRRERALPVARGLSVAVVAFLAVSVASSAFALDPSKSVTKVFALVTAAALMFAVLQVCDERSKLYVVAGGAIAGLGIAGAQGVIEHYSGSFAAFSAAGSDTIVGRVQGSFGHPNSYGGFIAVLLPLALAAAFARGLPGRLRTLAAAAALLAVPALVFSYSRGAIAAFALGSILWLALLRPRLAIGGAVAAAVAALLLAPSTLGERFASEETGTDVTLRSDIWGSALDIYAERPLLGVGLNNFGEAYERLPAVPAGSTQRRLLHQEQLLVPPHAQNLYLNVLAEQGLVGLVAFLLLALASITTVYRGCRVRDPGGRALCTGIGAGLMTLAFHGLLDVTPFGPLALPVLAMVAVAACFVALDSGGPGSRVSP